MVHIIKRTSIAEYILRKPESKGALWNWYHIVESSTWNKPQDIIETFGSKAVDILGSVKGINPQRAIIDIKGNHLRVIVKYQFHESLKAARIYIKWIGTHAEYDKLCKAKQQFTIEMF